MRWGSERSRRGRVSAALAHATKAMVICKVRFRIELLTKGDRRPRRRMTRRRGVSSSLATVQEPVAAVVVDGSVAGGAREAIVLFAVVTIV